MSVLEPAEKISISAGHSLCGMSDAEKYSALDRGDGCRRQQARRCGSIRRSPAGRRRRVPVHSVIRSRLPIVSAITSLKVTSAAALMAASSALPSALSGLVAPSSSTSSVNSLSSCAVAASSSTSKRAATSASNGNWCSRRVQKAWMVCTFSPPGVSSALANSRRAMARCVASGVLPVASLIFSSSAASSSVVHSASVSNTRVAMLAAAALVKVMQRIFAGSSPRSSRLITRCTSTCVLPEPALAETNTERSGSAAAIWRALAASGISRARLMTRPRFRRRRPPIP